MGLFGDLFGGSSSKQTVTQKTTVNADIDIANSVAISTGEIAAVLAQFGEKVAEMTAGTKDLIMGLAQENAIDLVSRLQFIELLRQRTKQIGVIVGGFAIYWLFFRKRKK